MRFADGDAGARVTPILKALPPAWVRTSPDARLHAGRPETLAWAYERPDGGRSFGFTGGHYHDNWADESFRRIVTNGVLWAAKVDVPRAGAKVALSAGALERQLDDKRKK